ncbi:MAG: hypothetical protein Q9160_006444 [Pyrenula sp. 1 TL-2023]
MRCRNCWDHSSCELVSSRAEANIISPTNNAQQALSNASVTDFLLLEYLGDIGGRVAHTTFGRNAETGGAYIVELGANWVQGLVTPPDGPENPIWTLAKKHNITNSYSNYSSILTYNATGPSDYIDLLDTFEDGYSTYEQDAGSSLSDNIIDTSVRTAFSIADWKPGKNPQAQAIEWWQMDWEYAYPPEETSSIFASVNYNATFYQFSDENNFVFDPRGFNAFIKGEASTFLQPNDPRLLLNTIVDSITYSPDSVTVQTRNSTCYTARYAIVTFSVGVLQSSPSLVTFTPALPAWKTRAISTFAMGTYTKIFLQFPRDQVFWDTSTQFFLYADPTTRGYYPVFQSLDHPDFLPGSGILFVTVVHAQSYRVEAQSDQATKDEVLAVLRTMFGADNVPQPTAFMYPRWSLEPWAMGSYSNWPPGMTVKQHQNLRANVGRVWFAGEATSAEYFGFLQGAWEEGAGVGRAVAGCLQNSTAGNGTAGGGGRGGACDGGAFYDVLHGSSPEEDYAMENGWMVSSFQTNGYGD